MHQGKARETLAYDTGYENTTKQATIPRKKEKKEIKRNGKKRKQSKTNDR